jgi:LmbE family N-acetylglucosaminyl deacetylase
LIPSDKVFRKALGNWLRNTLRMRGDPVPDEELRQAAIVFAPHQDDETLGCGGTIIRKKQAGSKITLVFMTDGSASHAGFLPPQELQEMRKKEAVAAGWEMSVDESDIIFLDYQDGYLNQGVDMAAQDVLRIIEDVAPKQVFIPYEHDAQTDHRATHQAVKNALQGYHSEVDIFEYPVWFWHIWPWTQVKVGSIRSTPKIFWKSLISIWRLFRDMYSYVSVNSVLDKKMFALEQHHSQMTRLGNDTDWKIIADLSEGDFLECFFKPEELFYRYKSKT